MWLPSYAWENKIKPFGLDLLMCKQRILSNGNHYFYLFMRQCFQLLRETFICSRSAKHGHIFDMTKCLILCAKYEMTSMFKTRNNLEWISMRCFHRKLTDVFIILYNLFSYSFKCWISLMPSFKCLLQVVSYLHAALKTQKQNQELIERAWYKLL